MSGLMQGGQWAGSSVLHAPLLPCDGLCPRPPACAAAAVVPHALDSCLRRRFWLWLCDGLSAKDGLVIAAWAAYNAVWYSTILSKALAKAAPGVPSPRIISKSFASLMAPNLVPLLFPVSR